MCTPAVHESCFTSAFLDRADCIFLRPGNRYSWEEIVRGVQVLAEDGTTRRFSAVDMNTFRGFYRVIKECPGAAEGFRSYFVDEKDFLIKELSQVRIRHDLHQLQNRICTAVRERLQNVNPEQLRSYNKVRKPVDLYLMNLVAMASDLDAHRGVLIPLLFLPLDSVIIAHSEIFADDELLVSGLSRRSTYASVGAESSYLELQEILDRRAAVLADRLGRLFSPIYFDLVWHNRYERWGSNLFETNP